MALASQAERRHYTHGGRQNTGANADSTVADNFEPREVARSFDGRLDRERMIRDKRYLLQTVCNKFQKVDTYHRGLITSTGFAQSLQELGLARGSPEVNEVMQYCAVTGDGYVVYKDLLNILGPLPPRAKQTSANLAIFPIESPGELLTAPRLPLERSRSQPHSHQQAECRQGTSWADKGAQVRNIYARWERGFLTNMDFGYELKGLGMPLTAEFERLLTSCGPSRTMPFSKLMYALQAEENDGRRARNRYSALDTESSVRSSLPSSKSVSANTVLDAGTMRKLICDFVDGAVPAVSFWRRLQLNGVPFSPEIDRLIRAHESGNSVGFRDFARLLMRQAQTSPAAAAFETTVEVEEAVAVKDPKNPPEEDSTRAENSAEAAALSSGNCNIYDEVDDAVATESSRRLESRPIGGGGNHGDIIGWTQPLNNKEPMRSLARRRGMRQQDTVGC